MRPDVEEGSGDGQGKKDRQVARRRAPAEPHQDREQEPERRDQEPPLPVHQAVDSQAALPGVVHDVRQPFVILPGAAGSGERPGVDVGDVARRDDGPASREMEPEVAIDQAGVAEGPGREDHDREPRGEDPAFRAGVAGGRGRSLELSVQGV